jgi:serine/threonine-protein kinase
MAPSPQLQTPRTFGGYELLETLPAGGMAEVYRARNPRLNKIVAIKILRAGADADLTERFEEEARTAARLSHPHIVNVFDTGICEGRPYMVMEFLDGCDLSQIIAAARITDVGAQLKIALQIADALEYVNRQDIIHRDIKPGNIFVCKSGDAKLIDFGIAKTDTSPTTRVGFAVGTLRYMSPEQMQGQVSDVIDVYAFGAVLYELITGIHAVPGTTPGEVMQHIITSLPDPAPLVAKGTPDTVIRLIQQCTAKSPTDRPRGFAPVRAELERSIAALATPHATAPPQAASVPSPPSPTGKVGRRALYLGISGIAIAMAAMAAFVFRDTEKTVQQRARTEELSQPPVSPVRREISDPRGDMVLVGAGPAMIGSGNHVVNVSDYYIDKTEVTVTAWNDYCRSAGCSPRNANTTLPVTEITYDEAARFCEASGKRLPSQTEWEKAARGPDGLLFPWGNTEDRNRANYSGRVVAVGTYAESASLFGAVDLAGNVWEWVDKAGAPSPDDLNLFHELDPPPTTNEAWKAVYGGSYYSIKAGKLKPVWDFALVPARWEDPTVGFRCAKVP